MGSTNTKSFRKEARLSENMVNPDEKKGSLDGWNAKWVSLKDPPPVKH
jgi:hypothetical protein